MKKNSLIIISNERTFKKEDNFFCDNIEMKSLPEGLSNFYDITYISRISKVSRSHAIDLKKISAASNIFTYIYLIFKTIKIPNAKYLMIAITPYTFFAFLVFFLFRKKPFLWLRSSGHEEYRFILGRWASPIYHIMYSIVTSYSNVISCHKRLFKKKHEVIFPSQLDSNWFKNHKSAPLDKIRLLYVGRNNPEKGIVNFLKMFKELNMDIKFSIVSEKKKIDTKNNKINLIGYGLDTLSLIDIYDSNNIFILPSYTESYSQVIDESLSRRRPVIIFEEIEYIIGDRIGIFVSKRNIKSLSETIEFIMKNYRDIQKNMEKNKLPTKEQFVSKMSNILG